jgi:hypothetical protein
VFRADEGEQTHFSLKTLKVSPASEVSSES